MGDTGAGSRYHVEFEDPASGEALGLMLVDAGVLGRVAQLSNPYAAKVGGGDLQLSDLTDLSVYGQTDWRGGRGQEIWEEPDRFLDVRGLETRIGGQITLGPLVQVSEVGSTPYYAPASVAGYQVRNSKLEVGDGGSDPYHVYGPNQYAAPFAWPDGFGKVSAVEVYLISFEAGDSVTASLHESSGGKPGTVLASKVVAGPGSGWITFAFDTPVSGTPGNEYFVSVKTASEDQHVIWFGRPYGAGDYAVTSDGGQTWVRWNMGWPPLNCLRVVGEKVARSQSFAAPAGGMTCSGVRLLLRKVGTLAQSYTVALYDDSSGKPGTLLKSKTVGDVDVETAFDEVRVVWDSGQALTGGSTYHIVVEPPASADDVNSYVEWAGDETASYGGGSACYKRGTDAWTADTSTDLWFKVNDGPEMAGEIVVDPVRFNGAWYCAAGDTVYKWNPSTSTWDVSEAQGDKTVSGLVAWGDYLWAARGDNTMRRMSTSDVWGDAPGTVKAQVLAAYGGYLYRTDPANPENLHYTGDGTTWAGPIAIGPGDWAIRGIAGVRDVLVVANDVGLWEVDSEWPLQALDWRSLEDPSNGAALLAWARTGELFLPIGYGLYRWNTSMMVSVGPDQDAGLPAERAGKVSALCGTVNWLFAAVDAGASGRSSVLAYNGRGWHEIVRASQDGDRIRALGYETLSSPPRLWWGEGKQMKYVQLPDYSDNPYQWTGVKFAADGDIILPWLGTELLQVVKDWRAVVIHSEGAAAGQTVRVYYEVDRSGRWTLLGTVADARPIHVLQFEPSSLAVKTVGSGSTTTTVELGSGTTADMAAGDWVRIGGEIRQVAGITDADTFALEVPLSSAPASGVKVYGAAPAGTEIRLKLEMVTNDSSKTAKILAVAVYCQANVLDRWGLTLSVRVEDGMTCLDGQAYPMNAAALAAALLEWITRRTPFWLRDVRGETRLVKVVNASETQMTRVGTEVPAQYQSVVALQLAEVDVS